VATGASAGPALVPPEAKASRGELAPLGMIRPGPLPALRLTREEYASSITAIFGTGSLDPSLALPADVVGELGLSQAPRNMSAEDERRFSAAAEAIAARVTADLPKLLGCATPDDECVTRFVKGLGRRLYRRPLASDEVTRLVALGRTARDRAGLDARGGLATILEAMLASPNFLLKWELTSDAMAGAAIALPPHQLASRLAFFLTRRAPDDALNAEVDAGRLATAEDLERATRRLLGDKAAFGGLVERFFREWLHLDRLGDLRKSTKLYPYWDAEMGAALDSELGAQLRAQFVDGDGKLRGLWRAPFTTVNARTARIYGLASVTSARRLDFDPGERTGLLLSAPFLASTGGEVESTPPKRGNRVYTQLLCGALPPPPPVIPKLEPQESNQTTRQRFEKHAEQACAKACHGLIEPLGFGFENFGGGGDFRKVDNGAAVDASGKVTTPGGAQLAFANGVELVTRLTDLPEVHACLARHLLRFALGCLEVEGEAPIVEELVRRYAATDSELRALVTTLVLSPAFRQRSAID
jgi:hypothetical protein